MRKSHRLIVCLDGTWNKRDDTTNVFHHHTLTQEGICPDDWMQRCYYDEGVGTGPLDRVSGGAFGIGLEQNVREAYNWLVEHFHDGDEVYVFGFSRGAFTARSLVGFISSCGLMRRGAPLSVSQLWENHCLIGRRREGRRGWLERLAGEQPASRRINELVRDSWSNQGPLQPDPPVTLPERLLVDWSRRIRIRFLGLYDTVGAIGIDALAIPGLRGRLALHHNLHPTTIIQSCRHALAVDEHRRSFGHNAFLAFRGHDEGDSAYWDERHAMWERRILQRWFAGAHSNIGGGYPNNTLAQLPLQWILAGAQEVGLCTTIPTPPSPRAPLASPRDSYLEFAKPWASEVLRSKRWYREIDPDVQYRGSGPDRGAHSLVPICEEVDDSVLDAMLAAQRKEELARKASDSSGCPATYRPPNVVAYANRRADHFGQCARRLEAQSKEHAATGTRSSLALAATLKAEAAEIALRAAKLQEIAAAPASPKYEWLSTRPLALATLLLWATLGALGLHAFVDLLQRRPYIDFDELRLSVFPMAVAAVLVLVDWAEGRLGFQCALRPQSARWRACADALYWMRLVGLAMVTAGAVWAMLTLLGNGMSLGFHWLGGGPEPIDGAVKLSLRYGVPLAGATVALLIVAAVAPALRPRMGNAPRAALLAAAFVVAMVLFATFGGVLLALVFPGWMSDASETITDFGTLNGDNTKPFGAKHVGVVLLLLLALGLLINSLRWVNNPLTRSRLGWAGMLNLQLLCPTPARVERQFAAWWTRLAAPWDPADIDCYHGPAADAVRLHLRASLWRDIVGLIPVVALVSFFGLWFAWLLARQPDGLFGWRSSELLPLKEGDFYWCAIVMWVVAVSMADALEDYCHLYYLRRHLAGKRPAMAVTLTSTLAAWVKTILAIVALLITLLATACGVWRVAEAGQAAGWLGSVVLLAVVLVSMLIVLPGFLALGYRAVNR